MIVYAGYILCLMDRTRILGETRRVLVEWHPHYPDLFTAGGDELQLYESTRNNRFSPDNDHQALHTATSPRTPTRSVLQHLLSHDLLGRDVCPVATRAMKV